MPLSTNRNIWQFLALTTILFILFFAILFYFEDIFIVLIAGAVLILIAEKVIKVFNRFMDRFPNCNRKAVGLVLLTGAGLAVLFLVGSQVQSLGVFIGDFSNIQQDYASGASALFSEHESELSKLTDSGVIKPQDLQKIGNTIFSGIADTVSKVSYYFFTGVLIIPLMFSVYFKHHNKIENYIQNYAPPEHADGIAKALKSMGRELEDFFSAKMLESTIVGLICCIGFYLGGLEGWLFLGILAGFLNIIPYIGPLIGAIPPVIVGYIDSPMTALLAVITVIIAQLIDNLYLIPFMISGKVNINPLLSVVLTLAASKLLGPLGMVLAIPIYILYKIIIRESYRELVNIYCED
ncbi:MULTISPECIES: AI-2E family transporter [unclassified Methanosarcina]|uniref:AI-2E family transporter n=1 Tax=unclassified Methanosarcina TaxID=2644672 RepID=UPI00061576A7|nr:MULTISPECIES: AI-2E family transporter [unclassified Methanosarcina]AKB18306.1 ABC transporter, permease protein [Methanosarcina sp. WWM596]AKB22122.1 ABC transporter, permease protein [Methanosarcina sp. WH1]